MNKIMTSLSVRLDVPLPKGQNSVQGRKPLKKLSCLQLSRKDDKSREQEKFIYLEADRYK